MKNRTPVIAASALVILWVEMLFAIALVMNLFVGFKVEMPLLTMAVIGGSRFFGGLALPLSVLVTALLLAFRQFVGWVYALVLCCACDIALLGILLPVVSLVNDISGSYSVSGFLGSLQGVLCVSVFLLNQALFMFLLVKRRDFGR